MSSSMALRRSPKPGAFTAATFRPPRSLLTTSVASASPSMSSAMMSSGRPDLHHRFQHRQERLQRGELLFEEQDLRVFQQGLHLVRVGDEVGGQVAAVELHAFDDVQLGFGGLGFFDGDDAFVADLFHGAGRSSRRLPCRRWRRWCRLGRSRSWRRPSWRRLDVGDHGGDRLVDAALQVHRVTARGDRLQAFGDDRLGQDGGGGGAVAGLVVGLGGDFADQLGAEVLEAVGKLDFLGDGDAVLGGAGSAEATSRSPRCGPWDPG